MLCEIIFLKMSDDEFDLFGLRKVPPLISRIKNGDFDENTLKSLRNLCPKGRETQDLILNSLPNTFFEQMMTEDNQYLVGFIQLCNNICVQNEESQKRLFPLISSKFAEIKWEVKSATAALMFTVTCTQPNSEMREKLNLKLIEPFLDLPDDDELEFYIITLLPKMASEALDYSFEHKDITFLMLDRIHDALEHQPELFDHKVFIPKLLSYIKMDVLPIHQTKSKIMGIFAAFVGCSENARREALDEKAIDIILKTKKIDINEPTLLEWSSVALRFLQGDEDTEC